MVIFNDFFKKNENIDLDEYIKTQEELDFFKKKFDNIKDDFSIIIKKLTIDEIIKILNISSKTTAKFMFLQNDKDTFISLFILSKLSGKKIILLLNKKNKIDFLKSFNVNSNFDINVFNNINIISKITLLFLRGLKNINFFSEISNKFSKKFKLNIIIIFKEIRKELNNIKISEKDIKKLTGIKEIDEKIIDYVVLGTSNIKNVTRLKGKINKLITILSLPSIEIEFDSSSKSSVDLSDKLSSKSSSKSINLLDKSSDKLSSNESSSNNIKFILILKNDNRLKKISNYINTLHF